MTATHRPRSVPLHTNVPISHHVAALQHIKGSAMPIFPRNAELQKLEQFRKNFLFLISDGAYPPHRQQRLFQWCQKAGLNWDTARNYIYQDALDFFKRVIARVVADGKITYEELHGLHTLQRRLGLGVPKLGPVERLYDLVERKIEEKLLERAAYLSCNTWQRCSVRYGGSIPRRPHNRCAPTNGSHPWRKDSQ